MSEDLFLQQLYVIVLGMSKYQNNKDLPGVEKDVRNMKDLFENYYKYNY